MCCFYVIKIWYYGVVYPVFYGIKGVFIDVFMVSFCHSNCHSNCHSIYVFHTFGPNLRYFNLCYFMIKFWLTGVLYQYVDKPPKIACFKGFILYLIPD